MSASPRMPALFIGHGSPMNTLESNRYTQAWRRLGETIPKPTAVLAISAHWYIRGTAVGAMERPRTIHDFRGFPEALNRFDYPAPGSPALAQRTRDLLHSVDVHPDQSWGLDHGTWSILAHVYPDADVPVVQLAMDATQPPQFHYELGKQLSALRDENVLIVGSGNVVHNLGVIKWGGDGTAYPWAEAFDRDVRTHVLAREHAALIDYERMGEAARLSVPTPEHYLPLLYILALQRDDEPVSIVTDGVELGSIGMMSVMIGTSS